MATRGKEPQPSKEKRGTSPSQRKSPSISKQGSPAKRHDTITSERNVPNYLKPTISSSLDPSKHHVKKASSSDSLNKATISRRRSLEKPLPISHVQKTRISPNPRERNVRSSSFNSKTTTSQKPLSDRLSKVSKDALKDHSLHPRLVSVKKSRISEKKQDTEGAAISRKAPTVSLFWKITDPIKTTLFWNSNFRCLEVEFPPQDCELVVLEVASMKSMDVPKTF